MVLVSRHGTNVLYSTHFTLKIIRSGAGICESNKTPSLPIGWKTLVERESFLKFQNEYASSLLKHGAGNPPFVNLLFPRDVAGGNSESLYWTSYLGGCHYQVGIPVDVGEFQLTSYVKEHPLTENGITSSTNSLHLSLTISRMAIRKSELYVRTGPPPSIP